MELKQVKTIGIIGVGFMGGSLALALKNKYKDIKITGYARNQRSFQKLKEAGFLDKVERDLKELAKQADILVLATPVGIIINYLKKISPYLKKGAIVFDLGSTKGKIEETGRKVLPKEVSFVGCHPFCGSEKRGIEEAKADLYRGVVCFITSKNKASFLVEKIWKEIGSRVVRVDPAGHDELTCAISHYPHLLCFSLFDLISDKYLKFSSSGFKDLTRIAASSESLWTDIFLTNKKRLLNIIDRHIGLLGRLKDVVKKEDRKKLQVLIKRANKKRNKIK